MSEQVLSNRNGVRLVKTRTGGYNVESKLETRIFGSGVNAAARASGYADGLRHGLASAPTPDTPEFWRWLDTPLAR